MKLPICSGDDMMYHPFPFAIPIMYFHVEVPGTPYYKFLFSKNEKVQTANHEFLLWVVWTLQISNNGAAIEGGDVRLGCRGMGKDKNALYKAQHT